MSKDYSSEYDYIYKILIIGDSGVGKSSILLNFTKNIFTDSFISTIGVDFKVKTISIEDKIVKLQIWDTAGQERFKTITSSYYRGGHGVIIVFDLTNRNSFENVSIWLNEIKSFNGNDIPKLLVGNKSDLKEEREVSKTEIEEFIEQNELSYLETSSKDSINIYNIFESISLDIKNKNIVPENFLKMHNINQIEDENKKKKQDTCCA